MANDKLTALKNTELDLIKILNLLEIINEESKENNFNHLVGGEILLTKLGDLISDFKSDVGEEIFNFKES